MDKSTNSKNLKKRIIITLLVLILLSPLGLFLPMFFYAGDAWGEWSAETIKGLIGYVPEGLMRYTDIWKAPIPDYTLSNSSVTHESFYYILSGLIGAGATLLVTWLITKLLMKRGK